MVTGANAGIGREIVKFFAAKGATVYMVCRNEEKGKAAKEALVSETKNQNLHLLLGDCSLERDVRKIWNDFTNHQKTTQVPQSTCSSEELNAPSRIESFVPRLDALICNAGALLNTKTLTDEGIEVTFGAHLLFGTYLLG